MKKVVQNFLPIQMSSIRIINRVIWASYGYIEKKGKVMIIIVLGVTNSLT